MSTERRALALRTRGGPGSGSGPHPGRGHEYHRAGPVLRLAGGHRGAPHVGRGNGHVDPPARPVDRADAVRPRHGVRRSGARGIRRRVGLRHGPGAGSDRGVRAGLDHAGVPLGAPALDGGPGHRRGGRAGGDRAVDPRRAGGGRRATSGCTRPLPDRLPAERSAAGRRPRSGHGARGRGSGGSVCWCSSRRRPP